MAKIYLIRHGESLANTKGIYQGQTYDTALSLLGVRQAYAVARRLRREQVKRVITSPLTRTRQTAHTIVQFHSVATHIHRQIMETNHGDWEGKRIPDIKRRWPGIYRMWTTKPSRVRFPNGETFDELQRRVWGWWTATAGDTSMPTVVVTHDNIIRIILAGVLGMHADSLWTIEIQPAGITIVDVTKRKTTVLTINDTGHLRGLEANLAKHAL